MHLQWSLSLIGLLAGYRGPGCARRFWWRSRDRGLRLRREAHGRSGSFVENSLSSSRHVDHVHTRSIGRAHGEHILHGACTNSCLVTRAARVNSFGLHFARGNSGDILIRTGVRIINAVGVRGGNKADEYSTRCQVGCPAVENPASLQQAPGRLHVETWAGRVGNPSLPISQVVEIMPGVCGYGDSPSSSSLLFRITWAGQRSSEWDGLVTDGENSQVWGFGCSGVPCRRTAQFLHSLALAKWGEERIVPYGVGGPPSFFVFLFILVWARHGCRATIWRAVLATA